MPSDWTPIVIAETALLLAGAALLVGGAIRVTVQRRWRALLHLPAPTPVQIQPLDPALALAAMWLLPQLAALALGAGDTTATSHPENGDAESALPGPTQILAVAIGQFAAAAAMLALGATRYRGNLRAWGLDAAQLGRRIGQAVVAYIGVWPVCFGLLHLTVFLMRLADPQFAPREHLTIQTLLSGEHGGALVAIVAVNAVILAPVVEEIFFRGLLQPVLTAAARSQWIAVIFSAAAFGLFHYPLVHTMPSLAAFGLLLGYLYARTGSLTLVVLVHALFNGKTLLWLSLS